MFRLVPDFILVNKAINHLRRSNEKRTMLPVNTSVPVYIYIILNANSFKIKMTKI